MGKAAWDPPDSAGGGGAEGSREEAPGEEGLGRRRWWRCSAAVVLGAAVVLSALFWLPPFAARRRREDQARGDPWAGADVVASFRLQRMISELCGNKSNLEYDIFEEIGINNSVVSVLSLEPTGESNWTTVTFGLWPYPSNFTLSPTELSILRSSLVSLVIQQSILHLTPSMFGNSYSFEILRFPGGITIIPPQTAFVPQKPDGLFNFSLNFPIDVVQDKLSELKAQMKSGLFLNEHEILYVTLTNLYGSTVAPPTVVQASVLLAVGADNKPPSLQRLKQLAQTLRNSSSGNLGLNHTVFGRVKHISLSSYLQHSLNNSGNAHSPSPAPQPNNQSPSVHQDNNSDHGHHHHHHHVHHRHHHRYDHSHQSLQHLSPAPAPLHSTTFPSCGTCKRKKEHSTPKHHSSPFRGPRPVVPTASPNSYEASGPYVHPPSFHPRIPSSALPNVVFHAMPPGMRNPKPPNKFSSISPGASISFASRLSSHWWVVIASFLYWPMLK
ncbi:hypothetical protein BDA96_01G395700 [Sorghum bicolor]|uniref:DUF7036 domain-containing protein n=2 Tax=Sorghum bicolor TaxID=4558 RepID=A0A921V0W7_SORBI|nr:uncharacterized protein LOC110431891 isoform X1 [Sorghum bicolor]KAG0551113.1 hypothetical protein BDA96_01G395700 [Sorghum bicolor]KXG39372.1 hypothetical protein SORBI_3001G371700 [Sorghum bicolor]|eukprot:XP_021307328.1 uncharacterized protein LOC110431891 isoform X1 [Sorghum bicolor]